MYVHTAGLVTSSYIRMGGKIKTVHKNTIQIVMS